VLPSGVIASKRRGGERVVLRASRRARKRRRPLGERSGGRIVGKVSIDDRADEVNDRWMAGAWEGDLVRHEALCNRVEVKDLRRCAVAAA